MVMLRRRRTGSSARKLPCSTRLFLNQILEQINSVERRIQEQIYGLETRLRRFERLFWVCQGILIAVLVIWAVVQFLVSNYQISFTLKP